MQQETAGAIIMHTVILKKVWPKPIAPNPGLATSRYNCAGAKHQLPRTSNHEDNKSLTVPIECINDYLMNWRSPKLIEVVLDTVFNLNSRSCLLRGQRITISSAQIWNIAECMSRICKIYEMFSPCWNELDSSDYPRPIVLLVLQTVLCR